MKLSLAMIVLTLVGQVALGAEAPIAVNLPEACKPLQTACEKAGFKPGAAGEGVGLVVHCMKPLMTKGKQPKNAKKTLPKFADQAALDKCRAAMPDTPKK